MTPTTPDGDLNWLVNSFVDRIAGARSAVVVTSDGLVLALSDRIARDAADQLAAVASGLASLTTGAARLFEAGEVAQVIVEMTGGFLFVTNVSDGSSLAVMSDPDCDIGLVGYEMSLLVTRIGQALTPGIRTDVPGLPPR
ncbi:MAG TPA: roadblock/LC7 domain-containing protein [Acidimicrobiales bacterium]|nr:roadblock/LC7 domain-containing protein [Acidimicrobiales bacterium]